MNTLIFFFPLLAFVQCELINLSCENIRKFVDGHNTRRLLLAKGELPGQPAASKMNSVVWDAELANNAAKWAAAHIFNHDSYGQNLFACSINSPNYDVSKIDVDAAMQSWFSENHVYLYDQGVSINETAIGHYTQLVWSDSIRIGCAVAAFKDVVYTEVYIGCNYGPIGNWAGTRPYKNGTPSGRLECGGGNCRHLYGDSCTETLLGTPVLYFITISALFPIIVMIFLFLYYYKDNIKVYCTEKKADASYSLTTLRHRLPC